MAIRDKDELAAARSAAAVSGGALAGDAGHVDTDVVGVGFEPVARSQWALFRRRFLRHKLAVVAGVVLILLYLSAIFAGPITSRYPLNPDLGDVKVLAEANHPPSAKHWFGTDELGATSSPASSTRDASRWSSGCPWPSSRPLSAPPSARWPATSAAGPTSC